MSSPSEPVSVTSDDGLTVTSTSETAEQITESLKPDPAPEETPDEPTDPKLSKAAAELGKKGGEAAAAKRAEAKAAEEAEAEGAADAEAEKLGKPRHDPKARMLEATRQAAEAKRERDALRAEKERLASELEHLKAGKAPEPAKTAGEDPEPKAEDFDSYEKYVKAAARWEARQERQEWQKEAAAEAQFTARAKIMEHTITSHVGRFNEAATADPTFTDRTRDLMSSMTPSFELKRDERGHLIGLKMSHVVADEIINSEQGPALTLHLADHPEEFQRLIALPTPAHIQRAMAKLEGRLEKADAATTVAPAPKPAVSKAHAPTRPVVGAPYSSDAEPDPESASFDEHLRYWNGKERAARR